MVPDEELLARSQKGDMEAFTLLVERYQKMLYTIAYRFLGNAEDAGDAAQEALVRAFKNLPGFRGQCSFKTWLQHIIANVCRDALRRLSRRPTLSLEGLQETEGVPWELATWGGVPSPEEIFLAREGEDYIHKLIQVLTPEYRMVIIMRDLQGFSYGEIATILGCSVGTVKSRLSRARQFLRQHLIKEREHFLGQNVYISKGGEGR
ncbi:MAG: polymerase sigma-70 factor, subfamily [Moorella sp. (in: firmicutes)]|uniref:RNA polymerase sigma factor n=1 Tax=unclassified Neomoorella TaxID=2676739 RepID=UPI0010FFC14E|nr:MULTISPECIES: sigma-70 family RNA polymerase sigma factor [unclassified Moorella (in: firmicutes)]MDK2817728.1 polymerase sigma-70 factor, subfamily [Moorella sp. (in: firmicutes)]MDK2895636.1 polymerase sigma-70 factor, subfamily [Moorella sp. (in: firmicutes)]GEA16847.1 sigma-24 [Moorella sp. E308F]GEA18874.1 sigma-24 [Moorella sp. E306M]